MGTLTVQSCTSPRHCVSEKIGQLAGLKGMGVKSQGRVRLFEQIRVDYLSLVQDPVRVNTMSSQILFVMVLSTTPIACMCMFVFLYSDNVVFQVTVPIAGSLTILSACSLLAIAADITSKSEKMNDLLCTAAARHCFASVFSLSERRLLLVMMEHASSESQFFAITTMDGQRYTNESFVSYLIEAALQYTLIISFNQEIAFQ